MDTIGKLLESKNFSKCWNKYRIEKVKYFNKTPFMFIPQNFPLILIVHLNHRSDFSILSHAINEAIKKKIVRLRLVSDEALNLKGVTHKVHYTYLIDLSKSVNEIYSYFDSATKKRVNKAISKNIKIKTSENLSDFDKWWDEIYLKWAKRKKFAVERYGFIRAVLEEKRLAKLFLAYSDDKIIAGHFVILSPSGSAFGWLNAHDEKHLDKKPNHLLMWEVIKWLKSNNYKYFDFGGAEDSKIFKEGFSSSISMWHTYDFNFNPIISKILDLIYYIQVYIIKKY